MHVHILQVHVPQVHRQLQDRVSVLQLEVWCRGESLAQQCAKPPGSQLGGKEEREGVGYSYMVYHGCMQGGRWVQMTPPPLPKTRSPSNKFYYFVDHSICIYNIHLRNICMVENVRVYIQLVAIT